MKLPFAEKLVVEQGKIVEYLLNPSHPDNGGKAHFFETWGFTAENWGDLRRALIEMAASTEVADRVESSWGTKFVVEGPLSAPRGTTPPVRTIWIVDRGSDVPRLVTAYPRR